MQPNPNTAKPLIYSAQPMVHTGYFHTVCFVQEGKSQDYRILEKFDAITDDFGNLHRLPLPEGEPCATAGFYAHSMRARFFDIDDESHALIWPNYTPPKAPPAVEVSIEPAEEHAWFAAEIRVQQNVAHDPTELLYLLAIGGQDTIYASSRELQGLASACADVLGLRLVPRKRLHALTLGRATA